MEVFSILCISSLLIKAQLSLYIARSGTINVDQLTHASLNKDLKWYYDQKITFIFSSDFETMFVEHSPSEIISLNFEKKAVNLNCTFPF